VRYASDGISYGSPAPLANSGASLAEISDFAQDHNSGLQAASSDASSVDFVKIWQGRFGVILEGGG